jgi:hypothetical protein
MRSCAARVRVLRLRLSHNGLGSVSNRGRRGGGRRWTGRSFRRADMMRGWWQVVLRGRWLRFVGAPPKGRQLRARCWIAARSGPDLCVWRRRERSQRRRRLRCHGYVRMAPRRNTCGRIGVIRARPAER